MIIRRIGHKGVIILALSLNMVFLSAFSAMADEDPIDALVASKVAEDSEMDYSEEESSIVALTASASDAFSVDNLTPSTSGVVNGLGYDSTTKTITLDGYNYSDTNTAIYIYASAGDVTIELIGDNSIDVNSTSDSAIYVEGSTKLTIEGSGKLDIQASSQAAIYSFGTIEIGAVEISANQNSDNASIIAREGLTLSGSAITVPEGGKAQQTKLTSGASTYNAWSVLDKKNKASNTVTIVPTDKVAPTITPADGYSTSGIVTVTMKSAIDGADIYYTTDGSIPTVSSTKYDGTSSLTKPQVTLASPGDAVVVKAVSVYGGQTSEVATVTYTYKKSSGNTGGGSGGGGGGGGSSSVPKTVTAGSDVVLGSWQKDTKGWWFKKAVDGTWPANTWFNMSIKGNSWYFFNTEGYMQTGWLISNGKTYYLNADAGAEEGLMVTGWKQIRGNWYYFNAPNGDMAVSTTTPDGYQVGADGVWR